MEKEEMKKQDEENFGENPVQNGHFASIDQKFMKVSVELRPEVLAVFGLGPESSVEDVKGRLENFDKLPILYMDTAAGKVKSGLNFLQSDFPQAFTCLIPKGSSTEIDLSLVDIPSKKKGNISLFLYGDPSSEEPTVEKKIRREDVIMAMKAIDDYAEEQEKSMDVKAEKKVIQQFVSLATGGKVQMSNIKAVIEKAASMGFSELSDFVSAYPLRYIELRKQMDALLQSKQKQDVRVSR